MWGINLQPKTIQKISELGIPLELAIPVLRKANMISLPNIVMFQKSKAEEHQSKITLQNFLTMNSIKAITGKARKEAAYDYNL